MENNMNYLKNFVVLLVIIFLMTMGFISMGCADGTSPFGDYNGTDTSSEGDTVVTVIIYPDGTTETVPGVDTDGDGIPDIIDTCPYINNPAQGCDDCPASCNLKIADYYEKYLQ